MHINQRSFSDINYEAPNIFLDFFSEVDVSDKLGQNVEDFSDRNMINFQVNSTDVFQEPPLENAVPGHKIKVKLIQS
jgi:hypothetical protein